LPDAALPVGAGGAVSLYALKSLDLIADVLGYFSDATAPASDQGLFVPLDPNRVLDTRAVPQRGGLHTSEVVGTHRADLQLAGRGGVPQSGVGAAIANVAATNATEPGFVTVYPAATFQPLASNLKRGAPIHRAAPVWRRRVPMILDVYVERQRIRRSFGGYCTQYSAVVPRCLKDPADLRPAHRGETGHEPQHLAAESWLESAEVAR
jgi:hypothetical protein